MTIRQLMVTTVAATLLGAAATPAVAEPAAQAGRISFRGMHLTVPSGWKVQYAIAPLGRDWLTVRTKKCDRKKSGCPAFHIVGPKVIKGGDFHESYRPGQPWAPGTGVPICRFTAGTKYGERFLGTRPRVSGYRQVGRGHRAEYREWVGECYNLTTDKRLRTFVQREWYLPKSRILIADGWDTPGLATIVKRATWN